MFVHNNRKFNKTSFTEILSKYLGGWEEIQINNSKIIDKNSLLAECAYYEAISKSDIGEFSIDEIDELFLKAIDLDAAPIKFRERKPYIYFKKGLKNESLEEANLILLEDDENPRAWAIKDSLENSKQSPLSVRDNHVYKIFSVASLSVLNMNDKNIISLELIEDIFKEDLRNEVSLIEKINRENISYWIYLADYSLQKYFSYFGLLSTNNYLERLKPHSYLNYSNLIFKEITSIIDYSQMHNTLNFCIARFNFFLTEFLINRSRDSVLKLYEEFKKPTVLQSLYFKQQHVILSLSSIEEYDKILQLVDVELKNITPESYITCAEICLKRGDNENSKNYLIKYLENCLIVDEITIETIMFCLEHLYQLDYSTHELLHITEKLNYENPILKQLLFAFQYRFFEEFDLQNKELVTELLLVENEIPIFLKKIVSISLNIVEGAKVAKEYIDSYFEKIDKSSPSFELRFYIDLLLKGIYEGWANETDSSTLMQLLNFWRKNCHPSDLILLKNELKLAKITNNYKLMEEVSIFGKEEFPNDTEFQIGYIEALCLQELTDENQTKRNTVLNESLLDLGLEVNQMMWLGHCCFVSNKKDLGAEILFQTTFKNFDSFEIKEKYLSYLDLINFSETLPQPEKVAVDTYVKFLNDGISYIEYVSKENFDKKPFSLMLGKEEDSTISEFNLEKGENKSIKIEKIFHKYVGLLVKIYDEVKDKPALYNHFKMYQLPFKDDEFDLEIFENYFKKEFGHLGTKREMLVREVIEKYNKCEIGFSELAPVFDGPIETHNYLTENNFIAILPEFRHAEFDSLQEIEYILDFTSIILFSNLSDKGIINFDSREKFIISQSVLDLLNSQINEIKSNKAESLSISVTSSSFRPIFTPENYNELKIQEYQRIFSWVKKYCLVDNLDDKLGLKFQLEKSPNLYGENPISEILIDNLLLKSKSNRILVTDDFFYLKSQQVFGGNFITTEYFLNEAFKKERNEIVKFMLNKNYRGLTVTGDILWDCFTRDFILSNPNSEFNKALKYSLSGFNPNPENLLEVLRFIKKVYMTDYEVSFKRHLTKIALKAIIDANYLSFLNIEAFVKHFLRVEFGPIMEYQKACVWEDLQSLKS